MARARSDKREKAYELWRDSSGEKKLKDIAAELEATDNCVRKWKNLDKWDEKLKGTPKGTLPKAKGNVSNEKGTRKRNKTKPKTAIIEETELTEKQRLFCLYYVKYWNAGKAAKKAGYECSYPHGFNEIGYQLLHKSPPVKAEVDRLKQDIRDGVGVEAMAVLQKYIDIAFADITEYLTFGQREVQAMGMYGPVFEGSGEEKKPVMITVNYIDLNKSKDIDGTILSEVSQGKDGIKIKLADKMKALEKLEKYFDLLPDHHKRMIEDKKLELATEQLKINKTKVLGEDEPTEDDGFIDALDGKVSEVWGDEN